MNGCCVDRKEFEAHGSGPRGCDPSTCMQLPEGESCNTCAHTHRCCTVFGAKPNDTSCQFFPRRFVNPAEVRAAMVRTSMAAKPTSIVLDRAKRILGVEAVVVRREVGDTLVDQSWGDECLVSILTKAVDTAVAARSSRLSTTRMRVQFDQYVAVIAIHNDGALGVVALHGDKVMKSIHRSMLRVWKLNARTA